MNLAKILAGLQELILRLGNNVEITVPPDGWQPHEWSYVKGIACGQILRLCDRLKGEHDL